MVKLTGALQMMSRRPPALALVQPGSTSDLVHVRMLLAGVLPVIEQRTAGLRADIGKARALRQSAEVAARALRTGREKLETERTALAKLEAEHRMRSAQFADGAMFESDRAIGLGEKARDIVDLMAELEVQAGLREELASLPGPMMRGRHSAAILLAAGAERWIAWSGEHYVDLAVSLADPGARAEARAAVEAGRARVFGDAAAVRGLEGFMEEAVASARAGAAA